MSGYFNCYCIYFERNERKDAEEKAGQERFEEVCMVILKIYGIRINICNNILEHKIYMRRE